MLQVFEYVSEKLGDFDLVDAGWDFEIIYDYSKMPEHGQPHMAVYRMVACEPRRE